MYSELLEIRDDETESTIIITGQRKARVLFCRKEAM